MTVGPGWYPSPTGQPGELRRWDGSAWTDDFQPDRPIRSADLWADPPGTATPSGDAVTAPAPQPAHSYGAPASYGPAGHAPPHQEQARAGDYPSFSPMPEASRPQAVYGQQSPSPATYYAPAPATPPTSRPRRRGLTLVGLIGVAVGAAWGVLSWLSHDDSGMPPENQRVMLDVRALVPAVVDGDTLADAERFAANYPRERDENGSYVTAGATLADAFGSELRWHKISEYGLCAPTDPGDGLFVIAAYCPLDTNMIMLNSSHGNYPDHLYTEDFVDTIVHEIAHKVIDIRCGTTAPPVAGSNYEGVTNSYAVLFLGADRERLAETAESFPEYRMTNATDAAATRIQAGDCGQD